MRVSAFTRNFASIWILVMVAACVSDKGNNESKDEKDSYLYSAKLNANNYVRDSLITYDCYRAKVIRTYYRSDLPGDTLDTNLCKYPFGTQDQLRILDTLSKAEPGHIVYGYYSVKWDAPELDSSWLVEISSSLLENHSKRVFDIKKNEIVIRSDFVYFGNLDYSMSTEHVWWASRTNGEFYVPPNPDFNGATLTISFKKVNAI